MTLGKYKVKYHDCQRLSHEHFIKAKDSFSARCIAIEEIEYLRGHPNAIEKISIEPDSIS